MAATRESIPPVVLELPSRPHLVPLAGGACGLVVLALLVLDMPSPVRVALLVLTAGLAVAVRRVAGRLAAASRLEWAPDGEWSADGERGALHPGTVVLPNLVVLALRGTRTRRWWIARRHVDPAAFRRLKMRLRHVPGLHGPQPARRTPLLESRDAE